MSSTIDEVVVGATRKDLVFTVVDDNDAVVNVSGGSVRLQGKSADTPAVVIDMAGTLTDPQNGKVTFAQIGTLVTHANLVSGGVNQSTYLLRVKYTDASAKFDYSAAFNIRWMDTPI